MSTIYVDNILPYSGNSVFISGSVGSLTASFAETASVAPNYTLSSSFLNYTSSTNTRIGNLEAFSSSLDATFATDAQLNTATSSLSGSISNLSSSFLSYTASQKAINNTFATTGSNSFVGSQNITGSISITGSLTVTDTITAQKLIVQTITSSVDFVTGSTRFGTLTSNTHQFTGSVSISGSLAVNNSNVILTNQTSSMSVATASFASTASFVTLAATSSFATTASYATSASLAISASYADSSSFATSASYTISASFATSASLATSASYADSSSLSTSSSFATSTSQASTASALNPVTSLYVNEIYPTTGNYANRIFTENANTGFGGIGDTVIYTSTSDINLYPGAGTRTVKVTGSLGVSNGITGSLQGTASFATSATSASFADNANLLNGLDSSTFTSTASFQNYTSSTNASISSINTTTSSLNAAISSLNNATASLYTATSSFSVRVGALELQSASLLSYTSSNNTTNTTQNTRLSALEAATASLYTTTASFSGRVGALEAATASIYTATASLNSFTSSQLVLNGKYATTASNTFTGNQTIQGTFYNSNTTNATGFTSTAAAYTDGGLRVAKDAYISGSTFIAGNLTVYGTSSINYVTASEFIGLEFIKLNTDLPASRYAGFNISDSGSAAGISSSLWYDSQKDNWLTTYTNVGAPTSSIVINGPITYNNVGNEAGITPNFLTKGQAGLAAGNDHHITSSQISDDGTTVRIPNNLQVTGSLFAGSLTGSLDGSNLVNASVANAKLTNSSVTINGTSLSLGGTLTQAQTIAGAFSGSSQVTLSSTTGYVANEHINHTTVSISAGSGLSGGGDISSTRTLTLDTGSVHFLDGVKKKLNTEGVVSSSAQIDHNSTTNYVANRHIDHTAVSISAGSGLSGGGDISSTRTLTLDTGSAHFLGGARGAISVSDTTGASGIDLTYNSGTGVLSGVLVNSAVTVTAGTGMSGGGAVSLGGSVTLTNAGVTSNVAGTGISVSGATGAVTITNSGVTSLSAGTGVSVSGATGGVTVSIGQAVATSSNVQFNSLGVGTAGSTVAGEIRATADITAYYASDERLKEDIAPIENPIEKLMAIKGVTFNWKEGFDEIHTHKGADTGVIAQDIEAIDLPDTVTTRENGYKAVKYEKLNALLIEGFKEQQVLIQSQQTQIDELKTLVNQLLNK
jgi:hypothetical protein